MRSRSQEPLAGIVAVASGSKSVNECNRDFFSTVPLSRVATRFATARISYPREKAHESSARFPLRDRGQN